MLHAPPCGHGRARARHIRYGHISHHARKEFHCVNVKMPIPGGIITPVDNFSIVSSSCAANSSIPTSHQPDRDRSRPSHRPMPTLTGTANNSMVVAAAAAMWQRRRSEDTVAEMRSNRQAVVATLLHQLTIGGSSGHSGWLALSYFLLDKARKICKVFRKSSGSRQEAVRKSFSIFTQIIVKFDHHYHSKSK